jgi:hypothetical protein
MVLFGCLQVREEKGGDTMGPVWEIACASIARDGEVEPA